MTPAALPQPACSRDRAGADAVDGAIDAMSGLTSQPNLGSIVEALRHVRATAA
jgi:pyruvate carboxylase